MSGRSQVCRSPKDRRVANCVCLLAVTGSTSILDANIVHLCSNPFHMSWRTNGSDRHRYQATQAKGLSSLIAAIAVTHIKYVIMLLSLQTCEEPCASLWAFPTGFSVIPRKNNRSSLLVQTCLERILCLSLLCCLACHVWLLAWPALQEKRSLSDTHHNLALCWAQ